jgi:hypothetical protein
MVRDACDRSHSPMSHRRRDAPPRQRCQGLVGDVIEPPDVAAVLARELVEPHVRVLRDEDHPRHPVRVGAEALDLGLRRGQQGAGVAGVRTAGRPTTEPVHLLQRVDGREHGAEQRLEALAEQPAPTLSDEAQLAAQVERRGAHRREQLVEQRRPGAEGPGPPPERLRTSASTDS